MQNVFYSLESEERFERVEIRGPVASSTYLSMSAWIKPLQAEGS
jgi:hypothetical protein